MADRPYTDADVETVGDAASRWLDGLGISDGYPDADHIAQHTTIREDSDA